MQVKVMGPGYSVYLLSLRNSELIAFAAVFFLLWSPWVRAQGDNFYSEPLRTHVVAAGETLREIADRYAVDELALKAVNYELIEAGVAPGAALSIPPAGGVVAVVDEHTSVLALALQTGASPSTVARMNGLTSLAEAKPGRPIYVLASRDTSSAASGPAASANIALEHRREHHRQAQTAILERAGELISAFEPRPQGYIWPLAKAGRVSSRFGIRNLMVDGNMFHAGLDIAAPIGTKVLASRDGIVRRTGWIGAYGYAVFVEHEDATQTRYAHLSMISVRQGESVIQGQEVGRVGSTGASTGPHLHFELRFQGRAVDPLAYLKRFGQGVSR